MEVRVWQKSVMVEDLGLIQCWKRRRGGRGISGETSRHDIEMSYVVIEVMFEAFKQTLGEDINPWKTQYGKIFPLNVQNKLSGFLVTKDAIPFKVNS